MLTTIRVVARDFWFGLWQPLYPLNPSRRWWHILEYWIFRLRDFITALLVFLVPLGIPFLIYDLYPKNPRGSVAVAAFLGALWIGLVLLAYYRGRRSRTAGR